MKPIILSRPHHKDSPMRRKADDELAPPLYWALQKAHSLVRRNTVHTIRMIIDRKLDWRFSLKPHELS
jgi:hypothetical protein